MKRFADLYRELDETTKTNRKLEALAGYFVDAEPADAAWAVYFLTGRRLKRLVLSRLLRQWCAEAAEIPEWLFDESYEAVGDLAETMALLLPAPEQGSSDPLHVWVETVLLDLPALTDAEQRKRFHESWARLEPRERLVFNKLVTGQFRVGVAKGLVARALARAAGVDVPTIAHRLMGDWQPTPEFFDRLLSTGDETAARISHPYPFCLAHPLTDGPERLGSVSEWSAEWKWDGIRSQVIRRAGQTFIWSRGEELMEDRFPEIEEAAARLPDGTVLDGEVLGWKGDAVLPFAQLQRRINRKTVGPRLLEEIPVRFLAFDLLEHEGVDLREHPWDRRRELLESTLGAGAVATAIAASPLVVAESWQGYAEAQQSSRERGVEGLMLKGRSSPYAAGRVTGLWWKWKVDPYTCDAVLLYAQRGSGRRASLYTDYTFAVWHEGQLVPFAKAYSGLTDDEIREVDRFVRQNTLERFGPVRSVKPELVFELAFENLQRSNRHKSGVAVRFPRMVRWRRDKRPEDADTLETIQAMIVTPTNPG